MTLLTLEQILAADDNPHKHPAGYKTIQRFCDVVDAGETPDADLLAEFSKALKEILQEQDRVKGLAAFGKEIGLNRKKGAEPKWREKDIYPRVLAAYRVRALIQAGEKEIVAVKTVMKENGKKESTIRAWVSDYRKEAKTLKAVIDNFQKGADE